MSRLRRSPRLRKKQQSKPIVHISVANKGVKRSRAEEASQILWDSPSKKANLSKTAAKKTRMQECKVKNAAHSLEFPLAKGAAVAKHFEKLRVLGKGANGCVYLVRMAGSNLLFAMKVMDKKNQLNPTRVKRVLTERDILASVNHPFIVNMYATFQTTEHLCFVMEYCAGGTLDAMLRKHRRGRFSEDAVRFYAAEVVVALEYLHHLGYIYRDLKTENILIRSDGHIALADFDLCKPAKASIPRVIPKERSFKEKIRSTLNFRQKKKAGMSNTQVSSPEPVIERSSNSFVGTLDYLAPEVVKREGQTSAIDWWALGVLIYELLTGMTPFYAFNGSYHSTYENIKNQKLAWPEIIQVTSNCKSLVKALLNRDPAKRLGSGNGALDIKKAKWFRKVDFERIRNELPPIIPKLKSRSELHKKQVKEPLDDTSSSILERSSESDPFLNFNTRKESRDLRRKY